MRARALPVTTNRSHCGEGVPPRARAYHAVQVYAHKQVAVWQRVEGMAKTGYEIAVLK